VTKEFNALRSARWIDTENLRNFWHRSRATKIGHGHLFSKHVEQAVKGCHIDFLRSEFGGSTPEPEIN
jgi:hypothetical protein